MRMSTTSYVRNDSQLHIFTCEFILRGQTQTYKFKYTGDVIDAYFACKENVIWSKHPTFRIVQLESKKA